MVAFTWAPVTGVVFEVSVLVTVFFVTYFVAGFTYLVAASAALESFLTFLASAIFLAFNVSTNLWYYSETAKDLFHLFTLVSLAIFFLLILTSVTNLWIFGALCLWAASGFFLLLNVLLMIFFLIKAELTSPFSSFCF